MNKIKPWFKIWIAPREVLLGFVKESPNFGLFPLCFIYGFLQTVGIFQILSLGQQASLPFLLVLGALLAVPIGYISINISAFFIFITGKILRGAGSYKEVRAAYAWSKVPEIVNLLLLVLMAFCFGRSIFLDNFNESMGYCFGFLFGRLVLALQIVLGIWGLVILFYAVAGVQKFAVWLAIINIILMALCYVALFSLLEMGIEHLNSQPAAMFFRN